MDALRADSPVTVSKASRARARVQCLDVYVIKEGDEKVIFSQALGSGGKGVVNGKGEEGRGQRIPLLDPFALANDSDVARAVCPEICRFPGVPETHERQ